MFTKTTARFGLGLALTALSTIAAAAELGLPPRGVITISFDDAAQNFIEYSYPTAPGGPVLETDVFEEGSRKDSGKLTFPGGSNILTFTPGTNCSAIGFTENKDWIGCFKKGGIGTGRLTNGQSLSVGIDTEGPAAGNTVTGWTLGMTAKQNVTAEIILSIDGVETEILYLYTGLSAAGVTPGGNVFTCAEGPDSNPDSNTFCAISGSQNFHSAEFRVTNDGELSIGSTATTLTLSAITGILTCEEDLSGSPTTTVEDIFLIDDPLAGAVQCRRLPNRSGAACQPVPYLLEAACDGSGECTMDFVHGDQQDTRPGGNLSDPLPRTEYAFLCEVWWPERTGGTGETDKGGDTSEGQFADGLLQKTEILWGGDGTPGSAVLGDARIDYCAGVTPVFDASPEPNTSTYCGDTLRHYLSELGNPGVNGGDVSADDTATPASVNCSLLEAYDDVLVPSTFPDQCDEDAACPPGRQVACLIDSRTSPVQGPVPLFKKYELIYVEGDLRMRSF